MGPDLDRIEQLARLRAGGALTEEEFQQAKGQLLAGQQSGAGRTWLVLSVGLAVMAGIAILLLKPATPASPSTATQAVRSPMASTAPTGKAGTPNISAEVGEASGADNSSEEASYIWATSPAVIDLNPAFLEKKLGPAKEKWSGSMKFEINGCDVTYWLDESSIESLWAPVTPKCQPVVGGRKITNATTFASLMQGNSYIFTDCLENCGNAYDPTIDLYLPGARANGVIDVIYSAEHGSGGEYSAREAWSDFVRQQHGLDPKDYENSNSEWFSCVSRPPPSVARQLRSSRVGEVKIGRDLKCR